MGWRWYPWMTALWLVGVAACTSTYNNCPALVSYDSAFNAQLAAEIMALPNDDPIVRALSDYIALRDQLALCQS